jgi:hypothetical protein
MSEGRDGNGRKGLRLDDTTMRALLTEDGWPCDRINDDTWRSHFKGKHASFPFFVRVGRDGWVTFAIVPFVKSPEEPEAAHDLYLRLLELNHALLMAKFSIDDDLDVVLSVEYPADDMDRSEFRDALDVLSYYADRHYEEIRGLSKA